jgi:hypothetical protein
MVRRNLSPRFLFLAVGLFLAACSSGGGDGGSSFAIESINVPANGTWQINRPIKIAFTEPVDFSSVSLNTINIRAVNGGPSAGEFFMESPKVVVFQPRCPTLPDFSDAGLLPGGQLYEMNVLGIDKQAPLTVKSTSGTSLSVGDTRQFVTPDSTLLLDLFFDAKVGPPVPVVRSNSVTDMTVDACYIELGDDPNNRVYFRIDATGKGFLDPLQSLPLNRLSEVDESVALVLHFNQPIDPSPINVNNTRLSWQFDSAASAAAPVWTNLGTQVELVANCTQTGAIVRITPLGILPPDTDLRVVIAPDFSDIVGQINLLTQATFALADTVPAPAPPAPLTDEFLDEYASSVHVDATAGFAEPPAVIEDGKLKAAFSFSGTGGVNGDFDWKVPAGITTLFSTDSQNIVGGPNFVAQHNVTVIGGVLDVRNMLIEAGAVLKVQGTNPLTILASGTVEILGTLDISGTDSIGIVTLNTTSIPEVGAPGQAGGGRGGTGSPLSTSSSPKGGNGFGAFNTPDAGGVGGETGWNNVAASQLDGRRGAGGGGGTLGLNQLQPPPSTLFEQSFIGLDAEPGFPNLATGTTQSHNGAITGAAGPLGGPAGPLPFVDASALNNFFGQAVTIASSTVIQGELKKPWAGAGGGAGGDASFVGLNMTFPQIPFNPNGDEKGAAGAGGAGSLQIMTLEDIVFGVNGRIVARGGSGGGGENTSLTNRIGGGSGGGSGGHVILQVAGVIDMSLCQGEGTTKGKLAGGILATGGQGGAGKLDVGGATLEANGKQDTLPLNDACPPGYPTTGANGCLGHIDGAGGDGGPGIVQFHTPDGLASVLLPVGKTMGDVCKPKPVYFDGTARLVPSFGRLSRVQSQWIALGEGGFEKALGTFSNVVFTLEGTDPVTGAVLDDGAGKVDLLPPILGPDTLAIAPAVPSITAPRQLVMDAGPLVGDPNYGHLLDNTNQMRHYLLRLTAGPSVEVFDVVAASYDSNGNRLTLDVNANGPLLTSFGAGATVEFIPAYFRVYSNDAADLLPASSAIAITLQATTALPITGEPDPAGATAFVADEAILNAAPNNAAFRFVRYQALFDMAASGGGLAPTNPVPAIDFLRIPFRYN